MIINLSPAVSSSLIADPTLSFIAGLSVYIGTLVLIACQNLLVKAFRIVHDNLLLIITNVELIFALIAYHFLFSAHRFYSFDGQFLFSFFSLLGYFVGLFVHYFTLSKRRRVGPSRFSRALKNLRFLIPFAFPFLFFSFAIDLTHSWIPIDGIVRTGIIASSILLFFGATAFFLPYFFQKFWLCKPMPPSTLNERLVQLCNKASFRYSGMKIWHLLSHAPTAAIVGIFPQSRYIMFTPKLLSTLSEDAIEAVLGHEIGHSKHKHLLIYPLIIFGMLIFAGIITEITAESLLSWLALQNLLTPSPFWEILEPLAIFIPYLIACGLYFRFVFGYFSRLFERQADLYPISLNLPVDWMIQALDQIGVAAGHIHKDPSWHHSSIHDRIEFLKEVEHTPSLIEKHHRRVKRNVFGFFLYLLLAGSFMVSPYINDVPGFSFFYEKIDAVSHSMRSFITARGRNHLSEMYIDQHPIPGNSQAISNALTEGYNQLTALHYQGLAEANAASILLQEGEVSASAYLMTDAWLKIEFPDDQPRLKTFFIQTTRQIVQKGLQEKISPLLLQNLMTITKEKRDANGSTGSVL